MYFHCFSFSWDFYYEFFFYKYLYLFFYYAFWKSYIIYYFFKSHFMLLSFSNLYILKLMKSYLYLHIYPLSNSLIDLIFSNFIFHLINNLKTFSIWCIPVLIKIKWPFVILFNLYFIMRGLFVHRYIFFQ